MPSGTLQLLSYSHHSWKTIQQEANVEKHLGWAGLDPQPQDGSVSEAPQESCALGDVWAQGTQDGTGWHTARAPRLAGCKLSLEHCSACRGACEGLCQAGRALKVPKNVILLIQGFVSLGPVIH